MTYRLEPFEIRETSPPIISPQISPRLLRVRFGLDRKGLDDKEALSSICSPVIIAVF